MTHSATALLLLSQSGAERQRVNRGGMSPCERDNREIPGARGGNSKQSDQCSGCLKTKKSGIYNSIFLASKALSQFTISFMCRKTSTVELSPYKQPLKGGKAASREYLNHTHFRRKQKITNRQVIKLFAGCFALHIPHHRCVTDWMVALQKLL